MGGGAAGLTAAMVAAEANASVVLLEANPKLGGTTAWSVGMVAATGTHYQRRAGIADTADAHFEDLHQFAGANIDRDNLALRRVLVDGADDLLDWLESRGLSFIGPLPEPPHRYPRIHDVVPGSGAIIYQFARACRRLGVDIRTDTAASRLIVEDGRVRAVAVRAKDGSERTIGVRRGVVLAAGDYAGNAELKSTFGAAAVVNVDPVNPTASGDGQRLGVAAGGHVVNGDLALGPVLRFVPPKGRKLIQRIPPYAPVTRVVAWAVRNLPTPILKPFLTSFLTLVLGPSTELITAGAVLANAEGGFVADKTAMAASRFAVAASVAAQPGGLAYIVMDGELADRFNRRPNSLSTEQMVVDVFVRDYRRYRPDLYTAADTVEDLARGLAMNQERLRETLRAAGCARRPPFVALGPARAYVVCTEGGLAVSEGLEVLDQDGRPIPGLFAAGSNGQGGLLLEGHGHHLAWGFVSGRIAGRNAAHAGSTVVPS